VLAAVVAVAAACSPAGPAQPSPSSSEGAGVVPLGEVERALGWVRGYDASSFVAMTQAAEERIAVCMAELGFAYWPQVPLLENVNEMDGPVRGSREFVLRYGYGAWNPVGAEAGALAFHVVTTPEEEAYHAAMSETEREAYETALSGPITEERADGSITRSGGCRESTSVSQGALGQVYDEAAAFLESLHLDPELDPVNVEWRECMAEQGHTYASPTAAREEFLDLVLDAVEATAGSGVDVFGSDEGVARAELERMVALADLDCQEEVDFVARYSEITLRLQSEFFAAHRADLEAMAELIGLE